MDILHLKVKQRFYQDPGACTVQWRRLGENSRWKSCELEPIWSKEFEYRALNVESQVEYSQEPDGGTPEADTTADLLGERGRVALELMPIAVKQALAELRGGSVTSRFYTEAADIAYTLADALIKRGGK